MVLFDHTVQQHAMHKIRITDKSMAPTIPQSGKISGFLAGYVAIRQCTFIYLSVPLLPTLYTVCKVNQYAVKICTHTC